MDAPSSGVSTLIDARGLGTREWSGVERERRERTIEGRARERRASEREATRGAVKTVAVDRIMVFGAREDGSARDALVTRETATTTYGVESVDVELGAREARARGRGRGEWMTRGRVAGALGVGAAAACCCLAALSGGRATAVGALGIAPDARGTPPPEYAFVRKARRAFGAALMRASYHQTASDGGAATAEEADALADAEAMADIEDKDFTRGGDYLSSSSSMATAGAGARRRGRERRGRAKPPAPASTGGLPTAVEEDDATTAHVNQVRAFRQRARHERRIRDRNAEIAARESKAESALGDANIKDADADAANDLDPAAARRAKIREEKRKEYAALQKMEAYGRRRRQEKRRPARAQTARAEDSTYAADESPLETSLAREIASDPGHPIDRIDENEREERIEAKPSTESSIEPEAAPADEIAAAKLSAPRNTQKQAREKRRTGFLAFKKLVERVRHKRAEAREREREEKARAKDAEADPAPKDAEADPARAPESERPVEEEDRVEAEPEKTAPTPVKEDTKPEDTTPDAPVKEEETPEPAANEETKPESPAEDDSEDLIEAEGTKKTLDDSQEYFKSINNGYFTATPSGDDVRRRVRDARGLESLHNRPGPIPGLVDHLQANGAQVGQMRVVTYANAAYWPVAKLFVESAKRFPDVASALTVMVTDRATLKDCVETGVMCFLDTDMMDILGERMNDDGSIHAGQSDVNGDLGKALRVAWTWRKVHVVYTLVQAGYGALFLDASTLLLRDPRAFVKSKLDAGALLVTLSDFGGALEQKAINTGLIGARPNEFIGKLLEDWMALEPTATDTEQASLTWDIAPHARADGVIISALSQDVAPSYLTFDVTKHLEPDEDGSGNHRGYMVHAAYCGSIRGKVAFLDRVSKLARNPTLMLPVTDAERRGCDVFDRRKYFTCGLAPWDGVCE